MRECLGLRVGKREDSDPKHQRRRRRNDRKWDEEIQVGLRIYMSGRGGEGGSRAVQGQRMKGWYRMNGSDEWLAGK